MNDAQSFLFGYDAGLPLGLAGEVLAERHGVTERKLSFLSSGPVRVPALVTEPAGRPRAAILVQHGGGQSKDDPLVRMVLQRWARAGYLCLAIDAPGHGERAVAEESPRRGLFEYLRQRIQNTLDLRRALDVLELEYPEVGRVGYWGVSMGGGVGVMLMAADQRVSSACLCLAGARGRRSWPDAPAGAADFAALNLDPLVLAPEIAGREVLMLNGALDETVPEGDARRLFEALPGPKDQRWFKTAHKVTPEMLRASREFFDRTL